MVVGIPVVAAIPILKKRYDKKISDYQKRRFDELGIPSKELD